MDLRKQLPPPAAALSSSAATPIPPQLINHYHNNVITYRKPTTPTIDVNRPAVVSPERIPTTTWGPFTIIVVVFLVLLTCFIINCTRIRRKVSASKMDRLGRSHRRSYERRHKDLQEADLEWNNHPPLVFEEKSVMVPEKIYPSNSSKHSSHSAAASSATTWSSSSTLALAHHYRDKEFIKSQPPGVQLRLTLEESSASTSAATMSSNSINSGFSELVAGLPVSPTILPPPPPIKKKTASSFVSTTSTSSSLASKKSSLAKSVLSSFRNCEAS